MYPNEFIYVMLIFVNQIWSLVCIMWHVIEINVCYYSSLQHLMTAL